MDRQCRADEQRPALRRSGADDRACRSLLYTTTGIGPAEDLDYYIPFGKAEVVRPGTELTVLTYLSMVPLYGAPRRVRRGGDGDRRGDRRPALPRQGGPRLGDEIGASIRKTNNVVVLEQGPLTVSYGALLADEVQRRYMDWFDQPVKRIHGGESSPSVGGGAARGPSRLLK
jgi:2-oxoisovalerate dehydrogenase E1 component